MTHCNKETSGIAFGAGAAGTSRQRADRRAIGRGGDALVRNYRWTMRKRPNFRARA